MERGEQASRSEPLPVDVVVRALVAAPGLARVGRRAARVGAVALHRRGGCVLALDMRSTPHYVREIRTVAAYESAGGSPTDDRTHQTAVTIGHRIRALRLERGRTLRQQAREIGISASSLSDIENSRGGFSLRRLQRVVDHFGLRLTDVLVPPDGLEASGKTLEVIRNGSSGMPVIERGSGVLYQVLGQPGGHAIQPCLLSFEPGGTYEDDMIAHPGEEFAYVLFGEIELLFGSDVHRLLQGDVARFRTETPHAYRNASKTGMAAALAAATPPW